MSQHHKLSDGQPGGNVAGITPSPSSIILKLHEYQDGENRQVQEREIVVGEEPEGFVRFVGLAHAQVVIETPGGPQVRPESFRFPIEGAKDITAAFAAFDAFRARGAKQFEQRMQAQLDAMKKAGPGLVAATEADLKGLPDPLRKGP